MVTLPARSIVLGLLALPLLCRAQDGELRPRLVQEGWFTVGAQFRPFKNTSRVAEPKFNKRFRLATEAGYRSDENLSGGKQVFWDLSVRYKFTDYLRVVAEHRFSFRGADKSNSQRTSLQAQLRGEWNRFVGDYRMRYQHEYLDPTDVRDQLRNRLGLTYDIRKWKLDPEVSAEFFTWFGYLGTRLIGTRYSVGTSWTPGKDHEIGIAVMHDREQYVSDPTYRIIYALSYSLDIN